MAEWKFTIDVKDIWKKASDREIEVSEFKKNIYEILSTYTKKINSLSLDAIEQFNDLMSELNDSEFDDYNEFDNWWCIFYDFCDDYKIWIKTI